MKKILRVSVAVCILAIITTSMALATPASRAEALELLFDIEVNVYVGNKGWIGMSGAAHPSMLFILEDGNKKNDNSLNGSSNKLINDLEELRVVLAEIYSEGEYELLQQDSVNQTEFSFTERLDILNEKLHQVLDKLDDSGINNPKQLEEIRSRIEISVSVVTRMTRSFNPICADFASLSEGDSVEGVGVVAPYLNIETPTGGAVKIVEQGLITAYGTPNSSCYSDPTIISIVNNGLIAEGGGFSDMVAVGPKPPPYDLSSPHEYTFTFDGVSISEFTLRMLDFGDWNPSFGTVHRVEMNAYDSYNAFVVDHILEYLTMADATPNWSDLPNNDDLVCNSGDASADPGKPGNWTWNVAGTGITKITLEFPNGFDPYIGFDTLCFVVEP
jgi:hypothetical protein